MTRLYRRPYRCIIGDTGFKFNTLQEFIDGVCTMPGDFRRLEVRKSDGTWVTCGFRVESANGDRSWSEF